MANHPDDIGGVICPPSDRLRARTGDREEADRIVAEQRSSPGAGTPLARCAVSIGLQNNESLGFGRDTVEPRCRRVFDLQVELLIRGWADFVSGKNGLTRPDLAPIWDELRARHSEPKGICAGLAGLTQLRSNRYQMNAFVLDTPGWKRWRTIHRTT
jgi:hypothetical protein